ncbi:MAG: NYN domain-containing protein [bacterium]
MHYALFIDFENMQRVIETLHGAPDGKEEALRLIRNLINYVERDDDRIIIRRAFADWEGVGSDPDPQSSLALLSVKPEYVLGKPGKNSADLALSLDALEVLLTRSDIQGFLIVAGDRDYIPVVSRIREKGKRIRIVGFPDATSGDLITIVGRENFIDGNILLTRGYRRPRVPRPDTRLREPKVEKESGLEPTHLCEENLRRCVRLILQAEKQFGPEIWLNPFYKNFMNEEFKTLTDDQRKDIIYELGHRGVLEVKVKEEYMGKHYSVLFLDHQNDLVKEVERELGQNKRVLRGESVAL